jgi:uncharacterized membrane protein YhaH (DUF805 family)
MDLLFGFSGRIGRAKWWLAELAVVGVWALVIAVVAGVAVAAGPAAGQAAGALPDAGPSLGVAIAIGTLLSIWINVAATVKRYHDRDKSGLWFLIVFVPIIGPIWQIVECGMLPGDPGANRFGPPESGGGRASSGHPVTQSFADHPMRQNALPEAGLVPARAQHPRRAAPGGAFGRRGR